MKWKLTEVKYKKLRKINAYICCLAIVIYVCLIRYAMKINPDAFITTIGMGGSVSPFERIESMLWWIVGIGWAVIMILFIREVKKNPNHWWYKLSKGINDEEDD